MVDVMNKNSRDSKRCMIDDTELSKYIYNKCKDIMPMACEGGLLDNVNERMRFLKYDHPGASFKPHCDGNFMRSNNERSLITMQIYLNEEMEGGATTFYSDVFPGVHIPFGKFINTNRTSINVSQNLVE